MGGTLGAVGSGLKSVVSNAGDVVKGTGQSVGDLKDIGYGDDDIKALGGAKPSVGVGLARGALRGGLNSIGSMQAPPSPRVNAAAIDAPPAPQVDLQQDDPYLASL